MVYNRVRKSEKSYGGYFNCNKMMMMMMMTTEQLPY